VARSRFVVSTAGAGKLSARGGRSRRRHHRRCPLRLPSPRPRIGTPGWRLSSCQGREPVKLKPRDPVPYFIERRAPRRSFCGRSHQHTAAGRDIREAGLQKSPNRPRPQRALCNPFGRGRSRRSRRRAADLAKGREISAETARKIYEFFPTSARGNALCGARVMLRGGAGMQVPNARHIYVGNL